MRKLNGIALWSLGLALLAYMMLSAMVQAVTY
jgi:hypothetical protein